MSARWVVGDPEPMEPALALSSERPDWLGGPWRRDPDDGRWVCSCEDCAATHARCGIWPARWPWDDLVKFDGPLVEAPLGAGCS